MAVSDKSGVLFLILMYKYKDYTLNYSPVIIIIIFYFYFWGGVHLRVAHRYFSVTSTLDVHTLHSFCGSENGTVPNRLKWNIENIWLVTFINL